MQSILKIIKNSWPFLLGLILGIYFITFNITGKYFTHFPGDLGDARFNTYILEHAHKFLTGQTSSLWNAPFMFPEKDVITYSDNLVGTAPFYSFFRLIGFDREASFQGWFLLMTILSYSCSYFFLNWYFKNKYSAVLGALVFAFSMALQSQITHAQTFPRFAIPLAFWMGILFMDKLKPIYFFATLFIVVYEIYCGIYIGFMLSIPITVLLLLIIITRWKIFYNKIKDLKWVGMMVGSVIFNILIILPLMLPYFHRAQQTAFNNYENILVNIPTIKSHFFSQTGSILWKVFEKAGMDYPAWWDHQIYSGGIATICLLIFGFIFFAKIINTNFFHQVTINKSLIILFFTGLITFLFFIRFGNFSLYKIIFHVPGFAAMRAIQRIINIELIFFAIATSFVFNYILKKKKKFSILIFILFAGIIILDNYYKKDTSYRTNKQMSQARVNILLDKMKNIPAESIVVYEPEKKESNSFEYQIDAMLASQTLNLKTVNGYSGTSPVGYSDFWEKMNNNSLENWFKTKNYSSDTIYIIH